MTHLLSPPNMTFDFKEDSTLLIRVAKIPNDGSRKGILGLLAWIMILEGLLTSQIGKGDLL
jgi:hypothetical protein